MYQYLDPIDDGLLMRSAGIWAEEKLDYVRRLIDVFETSMRSQWLLRNYIDLLAGPGKNRIKGTEKVILGSPLIALTTKHAFTGYYFIDSDAENTEALQERCKVSPISKRINIFTGDCNKVIDKVTKNINQEKRTSLNLAFLDPEGFEIRWTTVVKLAMVSKMDLLINYPEGGLNRMMAKVYQSKEETQIDMFFGTQEWRTIYAEFKYHHKSGVHRALIDLYQSRLQKLGYQEVRRGDETLGYEPLMRNIQRNAPLYRLIFASKNPLGQKFWESITKRNIYGQRRLLDSL